MALKRKIPHHPTHRISLNATVPGLYLCGFLTPPVVGADLRAALVASCFLGALPPVDLRAVCLVRAIVRFLTLFYDDYISFSKKTRGKEEAHKERACSSYIRSYNYAYTIYFRNYLNYTNYRILNIYILLDYFHVFIPHRFNHILKSVGVRALENTRLRIRVEGSARAQNLFQFRHQLFRWVY